MLQIKDILIAPTFSCNGRCIMCRNYQRIGHSEIELNQLFRFLEDVNPNKMESIQFSGGNMNMYSKYKDLCIFCGKRFKSAMLILTSNMTTPLKDLANIKYIRKKIQNKMYLSLPLDGSPETHNKVRGFKNSFDNLLKIIAGLSGDNLILGSSFTITQDNTKDIYWAYSFSKDNGLDFWANPENTGYFYNTPYIPLKKKSQNLLVVKSLESIIEREINEFKLSTNSTKYYYFKRLIDYYKGKDISRVNQCSAGKDQVIIVDSGDIYPCIFKKLKIGDIYNGLSNIKHPKKNCNCLTVCHSQEL